jgi:phosphoribosylformylglycinamidine synthase
MPHRLEIALKDQLLDAEGEGLRKKAETYFGISMTRVRTVQILTMDADFNPEQLALIASEVFTNPVTQVSSYKPLAIDFDWCIWVGYRPGVRDNPGSTAIEAIADLLTSKIDPDAAVYTSKRYCIQSSKALSREAVSKIASELLANDIIQQWRVFSKEEWDSEDGVGFNLPKVTLNHTPQVQHIDIDANETLQRLSEERNLALNPNDIPVIRAYFLDPEVRAARKAVGLSLPTDVELEYISQARSDHCNHNTFNGLFRYLDGDTGKTRIVNNLFKTCIQDPTLRLKTQKEWVVSVLWDNAGVGRFDEDHYYVITGETHNSPSNMEAYGGAITGIVGVYRDPMGTGKGSRLIMGGYGYCVGPRDYTGELRPHLHPRRLLDGVIEGVRDGGNKSGIPTTFGQVLFDPSYLGKCLVFVTAVGLMPAMIDFKPTEEKHTSPGELIIMCGGRVGKDGIHGVTAASETFSDTTPAGHVQIGDPYTQKKMHDFLLEARDEGLIQFITDNGGGGLSSSIGESARFSNGCEVHLEKVPLKYAGLDQWEIWVSESQERMTVAVRPDHLDRFMALSDRHAVESTVIGRYTDTGKLHITYDGQSCAYVDLDLLSAGFPQWEFDARWTGPVKRGCHEPVLGLPKDYGAVLLDMLARPNISSKAWISRQYDHEVQGTSVIKPLVGIDGVMASDASVIRPVLSSTKGLAYAQALLPHYSAIDAFDMTMCTIDEAVRRVVAVGGDPAHIGGVDNFCWPDIQYDPATNPDGKFKAAQLVRSCAALREMCLAYGIPLLSGKDSMYVDGHLPGHHGVSHKVSALETLQFSTISLVDDINRCVTMEAKMPDDRIYILGTTRNELGGSEYYALHGYVGLNVPKVQTQEYRTLYKQLHRAIDQRLVASVHGVYRGGLLVHVAMVAMGAKMGMQLNLEKIPVQGVVRDDQLLFSESPGRFIVTIAPENQSAFEALFENLPWACIGYTSISSQFVVRNANGNVIVDCPVGTLSAAWQAPFGDLI